MFAPKKSEDGKPVKDDGKSLTGAVGFRRCTFLNETNNHFLCFQAVVLICMLV